MYSIAVELTGRCNQRCSYCYNAWRDDGGAEVGELDGPRLRQALERVIGEADLDHVTLTGGEPFLRSDLLEIVDFVNARGLGVVIISNGGPVARETADGLGERDVHYVQISVAGPDAPTHDQLCGSGSFAKAVRAVGWLQDAGVTVGASMVCTRLNFGRTGETLTFLSGLGIEQIAFNRFNPSGYSAAAREALLPTRTQVLEALGQANSVAGQLGLDVTSTMPIPPCVMDEADYPHVSFGHCSIGTEYAEYALGPDGGLRLCTLQEQAVGNVLETSLTELLARGEAEAFRKQIPDFCTGCPYSTTCLGGCGAAAEWVFGSAAALDPFVAQHIPGENP